MLALPGVSRPLVSAPLLPFDDLAYLCMWSVQLLAASSCHLLHSASVGAAVMGCCSMEKATKEDREEAEASSTKE